MASCNFQGGKYKGATEVKAHLRHNSAEGRAAAKKKNKHINLDKTKDNFTISGLSYKAACDRYDRRIKEIDVTNRNKRRDRVTMVSIEIPAPENLQKPQLKKWFNRVSEIVIDFFGGPQNFVEGFIHVDEIHDYVNAKTGLKVRSRAHGHFCGIPETGGNLNGKKVTAKKNIIKLNKEIDSMTRKEFNCFFMSGEHTKSPYSVEELKQMSSNLEYEMELAKQRKEIEEEQNRLRAHEEALKRQKREIEEKEENARKLHEEAEEIYREAVRREKEANEKLQAAKEAEDADQPQEEKTKRRKLPLEFEMLFQKWERDRLGLPEPDMKQIWDDLAHRRVSGDSVEEDAAQEAQEYHIPFEFRGFVSDKNELEF